MPNDSLETCLNVWCIVDEATGLVYRIAARAYVLEGSDHEKGDVLKKLASADFHLALELKALFKYRTSIIDEEGHERSANGLFPSGIHAVFPDILDTVCRELEGDLPVRPVPDAANPRSYKMKFSAEPYFVLTFLVENAKGGLAPFAG